MTYVLLFFVAIMLGLGVQAKIAPRSTQYRLPRKLGPYRTPEGDDDEYVQPTRHAIAALAGYATAVLIAGLCTAVLMTGPLPPRSPGPKEIQNPWAREDMLEQCDEWSAWLVHHARKTCFEHARDLGLEPDFECDETQNFFFDDRSNP